MLIRKTTKVAAILSFIMATSSTYADPVAEAVFTLTGDYIKIGVSDYGTIGSKGNTNPGIQYDNTGTRTFNSSYDYLTPGAPFEGFSVKYTTGGSTVTRTNNNMGGGPVTGSLYNYSGIAYNGTTFDNRAVWLGTHTDFDLTNDVRFNNTQKFVDISSKVTAKVNMTDLYFARFIDPDARAAAGDSSATTNTLGFSPIPTTNVVFSEALASKYALGLYTAQVGNVGTGISAAWSTDPITYYSATNNGNGDYTIGIAFKVDTLNTGDIATFNYAYIFGPSTLTAGAYAVSSGAAGGTAGVVPGCVSGCEMEGVTPAEPSTPPAPTVVSTTEDTLTSRLSVFNRQAPGKTLSIRNTINTSTTPVYTDTYSDASTVVRLGDATNTEQVDNYSTRVDQYDYLKKANERLNQSLDSNVLDRFAIKDSTIQSKMKDQGGDSYTYLIAQGTTSNTSDTYKMNSSRFGIGHEKKIESNWVVGGQLNHINGNLNGQDASGSLSKTHVGLYSLATWKDWILKSDIGYSVNDYRNSHSLNNITELGPLSNSGKTGGQDMWVNNRVYTPEFKGFRPYAGVRVQNTQISGLTESGSTLTAMTYDKVNTTDVVGEGGLRYENKLFDKVNFVAEAGQTSNNIASQKVGLSYSPEKNVLGVFNIGQQRQNGVVDNTAQVNVKILF